MDQWQATIRDVWLDKGKRIDELALEIDDLNETMIRRVEQTLSHDAIQMWLDEYMTRSYQITSTPREKRRPLLKALKQIKHMTPADEAVIRTQLLEFDRILRTIERRLVDLELKYLPRVNSMTTGDAVTRPDDYWDELMSCLKTLSGLKTSEVLGKRSSSLRAHGIDWDDSNVKEGFAHLPSHLRDSNGFQFSVKRDNYGRIVGLLLHNVFYVCWFDPEHQTTGSPKG